MNNEHYEILKKGVTVWNDWRNKNKNIIPDLYEANLRGANLTDADLRDANLTDADLRGANLTGSYMRGANLIKAYLRGANLADADLRGANLADADLRDANLADADLRDANLTADLRGANLTDADLRGANLANADLRDANLADADLRDANLTGSYMRGANLIKAYLRGAKGILWLKKMMVSQKAVLKHLGFELKENHFIAYKSFNENHKPPRKWKVEIGETIKDHVDTDIYSTCSRGINVGTLQWCKENCSNRIYKVYVPFTAQIVIPIFTDGKIRVSEAKIIGSVK